MDTRPRSDAGFTLIELLVVMIVIGILAAIAIPSFRAVKQRAWVTAMKSDLRNAMQAEEMYAANNDGAYTNVVADLDANGLRHTSNVVMTISTYTHSGDVLYCLRATHPGVTNSWFVQGGTDNINVAAALENSAPDPSCP
jgi:type IV pilus assembly protein PilA